MATLPMVESGQIMMRPPQGGVPMVQVNPVQVEPIGARAAAQQAGTMAQILDRMSASAFREAERLAPIEALQYAADNPITPGQIELAKNGLPIESGWKGTIFDQALRKARSFELASHFEMEGKNELVKMLADVKAGKPGTDGEAISQKIAAISNGGAKSLAALDPEAALKFKATMATHGNTVLNAAYEEQLKREQSVRRIKLDEYMDNSIRFMFAEAEQDPETFLQRAEVHRKNVTDAALLLGDAAVQREYSNKINSALRDAQVNAITNKLMQDDRYFQDTTRTINSLRTGVMMFDDKFTPMMNAIAKLDPAATNEIIKNFRVEVSARIAKRDDDEKIDKRRREIEFNALAIEYFDPATSPARKRELAKPMAELRVMSVEQLERVVDPQQRPGDKYTFAALQTAIDMGAIPDFQTLLNQANRSGMSGDQFIQLNKQLIEKSEKELTEARRFIRRSSGTPDVQSYFTSKDDQFKIDKEEVIMQRFNSMIADFRQANPGVRIPYNDISRRAVDDYNKVEKADAKKEQARRELAATVQAMIKERVLREGTVIDENTSLDDIEKNNPKAFKSMDRLNQLQRALREVSR